MKTNFWTLNISQSCSLIITCLLLMARVSLAADPATVEPSIAETDAIGKGHLDFAQHHGYYYGVGAALTARGAVSGTTALYFGVAAASARCDEDGGVEGALCNTFSGMDRTAAILSGVIAAGELTAGIALLKIHGDEEPPESDTLGQRAFDAGSLRGSGATLIGYGTAFGAIATAHLILESVKGTEHYGFTIIFGGLAAAHLAPGLGLYLTGDAKWNDLRMIPVVSSLPEGGIWIATPQIRF